MGARTGEHCGPPGVAAGRRIGPAGVVRLPEQHVHEAGLVLQGHEGDAAGGTGPGRRSAGVRQRERGLRLGGDSVARQGRGGVQRGLAVVPVATSIVDRFGLFGVRQGWLHSRRPS